MLATSRTFKLVSPHMTGQDVRRFQVDLGARLQGLAIGEPVVADGDYGAATRAAAVDVCTAMGILPDVLQDGVTPELRIKIRHPENRTPAEIARSETQAADDFRARLRSEFLGPAKTLTGIDASNNTASVDWAKVKAAGHSFAFHKVSEGLGAPDRKFKQRWAAMRDAGLVRGAFHFARPQRGRDPKAEAREFLGLLHEAGGLQGGDLLPVLDIEAFGAAGSLTAEETLKWARGFVEEVHLRVGHRPIIYTGVFWREQMKNPGDNLGCRLWLAAYVDDPAQFIPKAWSHDGLAIWQHTEHGTCPGIAGDVDLNRLPGGAAALDRLRL